MDKEIKGIRAVMIFEVIGKPPGYIIESLEKIISDIDKEDGVDVKSKDMKKPTVMKDQKEFYTTFAEIEVEVEEILSLALLLLKYMPAHVEIISPELIALTNNGWNDILNELARKLHGYDEIARVIQIEKNMLLKKIEELTDQKTELQKQKPVKKTKTKKKK